MQKIFDLIGNLSDNIFVHLPRVEGAQRSALSRTAAFLWTDAVFEFSFKVLFLPVIYIKCRNPYVVRFFPL